MTFNDSFGIKPQIEVMQNMFNSAQIRYNRGDQGGASNTFYNMARQIKGRLNLQHIKSTKGAFEEAKIYYNKGNISQCLAILKYNETEILYGRYKF